MRSKPTIDLLFSPFLSQNIQFKSNKPIFGSFNNHTALKFSSSKTHSLFLDEFHRLYGIGSNSKNQLSSKKLKSFVLPVHFDLIKNDTQVIDFVCGENFSAILTETQELNIFGCTNTIIKESNIRGLSSSNNTFSFAFNLLNVYVGTIDNDNQIQNQIYELPAPILMTALNDSIIAALGQDGKVYFSEIGKDNSMKEIKLNTRQEKSPHIRLISAAHDSLAMMGDHYLYVYRNHKLTSHYIPIAFDAVYGCSCFNDVFALSSNGKLCHCSIRETEMSHLIAAFESICPCSINQFDSISHISLNGSSAIFIKGNPEDYQYEYVPPFSPVPSNLHIKTSFLDSTFLCCTNKTAYFSDQTIPFSDLSSVMSMEHIEGAYYYTSSQRPIQIVDDTEFLHSLYLSKGDIIKIRPNCTDGKPADEGQSFEVVGAAEGYPWARPINSQYVVSLPNDLELLIETFIIPYETKSYLKKMKVAHHTISVDVNPQSVNRYGYCIGDLLWHPLHGVVEIIGYYREELILLEFCERQLFKSHKNIQYKVVRRNYLRPQRKSEKRTFVTPEQCLQCTRDVVDSNGELISLDITSGPYCPIFLPMDRVLTPYGEATLLGYNKTPYIQTDQMKMNGYEAASCNIFDLKLIRRINAPAKRTVNLINQSGETKSVKVSLNIEDSPNDLMPGDKIQVDNRYATVIGFAKNKHGSSSSSEEKVKGEKRALITLIQYKGEENCRLLPSSYTLIYRADINGYRKDSVISNTNVGTPLISESLILPGDIVFQKDLGKLIFFGYNENWCLFYQISNCDIITLGFSVTLLPDFFEVLQRPVLDFWKPDK